MAKSKVFAQTVQSKVLAVKVAGFFTLLMLWQLASINMSEMVLASPYQSVSQLLTLLSEPQFWHTLSVSLVRLTIALLLGGSIGFILGLWSGRNVYVKQFLSPFRWLLMSIPPVIVVLLAMLWFGMGDKMVVFIAVLLLSPSIYINTQKGIEQIDPAWLELAQVYRFSLWQRLSKIYIPAIAAPLCAALVIVCCNGVRIIVLAEVLGADNGLGYELANARSNFDISELYAWVTTSLLLVALLEFMIFQPLQNRLLRWQQ